MDIYKTKNRHFRITKRQNYEKAWYELLLRQLEVCLKFYKPHFELEYQYQPEASQENKQFEFQQRKFYLSLSVFDNQQNIKKRLIVFENSIISQKAIDYYIQLLKYFPRKDLIYHIYDSYYLDSKKTFYVFEMEHPKTINFQNFIDYFDVVQDTIQKIQTAFCDQLIIFDRVQLAKQFRSSDKNKIDLFNQEYLIRIFSDQTQIETSMEDIQKQMYAQFYKQTPLSICFFQFEDIFKNKLNQIYDLSDQEEENTDDDNENIQQEDIANNNDNDNDEDDTSQKVDSQDLLSVFSSIFDQDSQLNYFTKSEDEIESQEGSLNSAQDLQHNECQTSSAKSFQRQKSSQKAESQTEEFSSLANQSSKQKKLKGKQSNQQLYKKSKNKKNNKPRKKSQQVHEQISQELISENESSSQSQQENKSCESQSDLEEEISQVEEEDISEIEEDEISQVEEEDNDQISQNNSEDKISEQSKPSDEEQDSILSSFWNFDQELLQQLIDFQQSIFITIKKDSLVTKIKEIYPDILNYHQEDIFFLLQQHPKYDDFELLSYNSEQFKLKCRKDDNDFKTLLVKKFSCFQKIQEEEKLINQLANITNNLIFTEILLLEKYSYLLVEQKYFQPNNQIYLYPNFEDLIKQLKYQNQLKFLIFKLFIQVSYELFSRYKIKITNVSPSKIFFYGNHKTINGEKNFRVIIKEISQERFDKQYIDLIKSDEAEQELSQYYEDNSKKNLVTLMIQFINNLNDQSQEDIFNIYNQICQHINLLLYFENSYDMKIINNNKLHQDFVINDRQYSYQQEQLTTSLGIDLAHYIELTNDIFDKNLIIYHNFFKLNEWSLPSDQQEEFQKHLNLFYSYLEKINQKQDNLHEKTLQKNDDQEISSQKELDENQIKKIVNLNQSSILLELKALISICFEHNLKKKVSCNIEITDNQLFENQTHFTSYDYQYYKISNDLLKQKSQVVKIELKKSLSKVEISFVNFQQKIFVMDLTDSYSNLKYYELTKENFSLANLQRLMKRILYYDEIQNNDIKLNFKLLQNFENLQRLALNLSEENLYETLKDYEQIQLFRQHQKILQMKLQVNYQTQGLPRLIKHINFIKDLNTIIIDDDDFNFDEEYTKKSNKFINQLKKLKRVTVVKSTADYLNDDSVDSIENE
ncbi:hypothetical protein TTHERM_00613640 (macronuclear) [Tetrahymena thermophila SB210]|uniref:Uncharacterized protein n=1 Tax=Tetrahymena thermophila (strain SB210) TaxID=312017 RepID=Q22YC1_TETTS|nr:hypothetical protein TTHERM_00613640 [Tetrahymena thermophila SB210]EAR90364.2 hypothetical protein TTHERM_00613640 [Tetrahymena thermophila SB210]|eukprot:XP_001010609.2 hypothetical protein TTHERM_00613640 [Tetrahymena thermophila SB210]